MLCVVTAACATSAAADITIDGQTLTANDILSYDISVVDGNYSINITTLDGWTLAPSDGPVEPPPPPPPPPATEGVSTTLTAGDTVVEIGDRVMFTWTANEATFCDTRWGNAEWKNFTPSPAGGSVAITMDTLGEQQFRMYCEDASGDAQAVGVFVTVNPLATNTDNCPSPEVSRGNAVSWNEYLGANYPNVANLEQRKFLGRNDYVAVKFNTANFDVRGSFKTVQVSGPNRFVSVSECPGRFTDAEPGCFDRQANGDEIQWSTTGTFGNCQLDKNKDYYLNITYFDVEERDSSLCSTSSCAFNVRIGTIID